MQQNKRPIIIGITGTMGSGKTTVCRMIEKHYMVFYADEIAHTVLSEPSVIEKLIKKWGRGIITNGSINRKVIADKVFNNSSELKYLNELLHPEVLKLIQQLVNESTSKYFFIEVPLLFEENLQACFDYIVLVAVSLDKSTGRIANRDGLPITEIMKRINHQTDNIQKASMSDYIIENNGLLSDLSSKVDEFLSYLDKIIYRDIAPFYNLNPTN